MKAPDDATRYGTPHGMARREVKFQGGCWEDVPGGLQRTEVPTGWLYRYTYSDRGANHLVFVPRP